MTGFSLDFENTFEGTGIADGTYEVVISLTGEDATKGGAEYAEFRLTLRNDIDQKHKNMIIFEKLWKAKATGKYNMMMFNTIGKAAQLPKGKSYSSMEDLLNDYVGKPLKVTVKNEKSDCGKYDNLNVKHWDVTSFPNVQHKQKVKENAGGVQQNYTRADNDPFSTGGGPIEVSDDDLPF